MVMTPMFYRELQHTIVRVIHAFGIIFFKAFSPEEYARIFICTNLNISCEQYTLEVVGITLIDRSSRVSEKRCNFP